jgi:hypothetical protein
MDNLENKKNVDTYIDKDKFQFITSFEKKEIFNTKGEKIIIDFGTLDIDERIFLSSFLTYVVQNDGAGKKINSSNLYDIIFDFNSTKKRKAGFYDAFISSISEFIRTKPQKQIIRRLMMIRISYFAQIGSFILHGTALSFSHKIFPIFLYRFRRRL